MGWNLPLWHDIRAWEVSDLGAHWMLEFGLETSHTINHFLDPNIHKTSNGFGITIIGSELSMC